MKCFLWHLVFLLLLISSVSVRSNQTVLSDCLEEKFPDYNHLVFEKESKGRATWGHYLHVDLQANSSEDEVASYIVKNGKLRRIFEEEIAKCILNQAISEMENKHGRSLFFEEVAEEAEDNHADGVNSNSEHKQEVGGGGSLDKKETSNGSLVDNTVYALTSMATEKIKAEAVFYAKQVFLDDLCDEYSSNKNHYKNKSRFIALETCSLQKSINNDFYNVSLQHIIFSIREDILNYPRNNLVWKHYDKIKKNSQEKLTEENLVALAWKDAYETEYDMYLPAVLRLVSKIESPQDLRYIFHGLKEQELHQLLEFLKRTNMDFYGAGLTFKANIALFSYLVMKLQIGYAESSEELKQFLEPLRVMLRAYNLTEQGRMRAALLELIDYFSEKGVAEPYVAKLTWAAQLADAKTPDDVAGVLQEMRAPFGSYKYKSKKVTQSLFASAGLSGGRNLDEEVEEYRFIARLGYEVSFPYHKGYLGARVTVLDFANQFFNEDENESTDGYAGSLLYPGFGAFVSIGKSPIILSADCFAGVQKNQPNRCGASLEVSTSMFNF